jgi:hypothetical protein
MFGALNRNQAASALSAYPKNAFLTKRGVLLSLSKHLYCESK